MSNSWFQFKQFLINQGQCAMKVGTDGVLLGAWVNMDKSETILDIGTGTGLIALIAAQKSHAVIDAVEIDKEAVEQARENFENSKWNNRLKIFHASFQKFAEQCNNRYDVILCNPPYFHNSWKAPDCKRTLARHADELKTCELLKGVTHVMNTNSRFSLILPVQSEPDFIKQARSFHLYPERITRVHPLPHKPPHRILISLTGTETACTEGSLIIENGKRHSYSEEYISLTRDFYLKF